MGVSKIKLGEEVLEILIIGDHKEIIKVNECDKRTKYIFLT